MANLIEKHSISYELAQKMVDEAVSKARELGVSENVAILDDGGNLKAFNRMDGAPILSIEMAQNKAYTALFGIPTQDFFNFIQGDPSLLAGIPTLARVAAWGEGFPIKVDGEIVGAIGLSGAPTVQNDVDCARAALALVRDRNFHENKLGKGTLVKEMQTPGVLNNGKQNNYALGLIISNYRGLPIVEHGGANFGYRTDILRFPQQRFTVVALCNSSNAEPDTLTRKVADIYLEKVLQPARATATFAASGSDPALFAGKYFETRTHYLTSFSVEKGNLVLEGHVLQPIESNRFEDPIIGGTVAFSGSNGVMKATITYNNEVTFAGARIEDLHLDETALAAYAGVYRSAELDATYTLTVNSGSLMLWIGRQSTIKFQPVIQSEFNGGGMTLVFRRDDTNHILGLNVCSGWDGEIRNESFDKLN